MAHSEAPAFTGLPEVSRIHEFLEAFEEARASEPDAPLERFLPAPGHPLRSEVLHEIIRIDMEHGWARGQARPLTEYQARYPEAFEEPDCAAELAFEEYRQRLQAGERPKAAEYAARFGVDTSDWPATADSSVAARAVRTLRLATLTPQALASAALNYRSGSHSALRPNESTSGLRACADVFRELHEADPREAERVAEAVTSLPEVGGRLGDFDLIDLLGRGAFGRVFLARQRDLAGRRVALKVSADLMGESQAMAQLLHNNVMPIYGCQRFGAFEAIWMPYLGATTLADVLDEIEGRGDLPVSGKGLVSTLRDMGSSKRSTLDSSGEPPADRPAAQPALPLARTGASHFTLDLLEKYSYVNAVLWLGARLADGLAHAHEHGILHRDLKPANILLSDEGQPILLDFNLASDTKLSTSPAAARVGGTLPYMSPEQLRAMNGEKTGIDARSDIFSLGVVLYELLTARHPYALLPGRARLVLPGLINERCRSPLPPRRFNRDVTPAMEAIVLKCLAAAPERRYQTARDLEEDLERQLANRPLRCAPEPSLRERAVKWARRHPRLSSSSSIAAFAALILFVMATVLTFALRRGYQADAALAGGAFTRQAAEAQMLLSERSEDPGRPRRVLDVGELSLHSFQVPDQKELQASAHYKWLPLAEQERLQREAGTLLFAMSRAAMFEARSVDATEQMPHLKKALQFNTLATAAFTTTEPPRALLQQRSEIMERLGQPEAARTLKEEFARRRDIGTLDQVLAAREQVVQGQYRAAMPVLLEVTQREPLDLQAWFLRARCHDESAQDQDAVLAYSTCLALQPLQPRLWFNRGLAYLRQKDYRRAWNDFTHVLELDGTSADAWFNRALAAAGQHDFQAAVADYTRSLELGGPATSIYFMRARAFEKLGNASAARADMAEGLRRQPTDTVSGLGAVDIAELRALYGSRTPDEYEGDAGNGSFGYATKLKLLSLADGITTAQAEADLTTLNDADYYTFKTLTNLTGTTVRLQTRGLSLVAPRLSVYDSSKRLIATVAAEGPNAGNLEVRLGPSILTTYYVKVESDRSDAFGIGGYVLKVDNLPGTTGLVQTTGGVVDDVFELINNDLHTDDTSLTASLVPAIVTTTNSRFDFAYKASVSDSLDVDIYKVKAPTPPAGSANVMTVMAWGLSDKRLDPQVTVYNSSKQVVPAEVLVDEAGKVTVQVADATAGASYFVKVAAADPVGLLNFGNYFVGVDFGTKAVSQTTFASSTLTQALPQITYGLTTKTTQLHHFVLGTTTANADVESAVRLTIFDANNKAVLTRVVQAGQTASFDIVLEPGTCKVRLVGGTKNKSKSLPDMGFALRGFVASDPVGPRRTDAASAPSGGNGDGSSPPIYSGGDRTQASADPYGDPYSPM